MDKNATKRRQRIYTLVFAVGIGFAMYVARFGWPV